MAPKLRQIPQADVMEFVERHLKHAPRKIALPGSDVACSIHVDSFLREKYHFAVNDVYQFRLNDDRVILTKIGERKEVMIKKKKKAVKKAPKVTNKKATRTEKKAVKKTPKVTNKKATTQTEKKAVKKTPKVTNNKKATQTKEKRVKNVKNDKTNKIIGEDPSTLGLPLDCFERTKLS